MLKKMFPLVALGALLSGCGGGGETTSKSRLYVLTDLGNLYEVDPYSPGTAFASHAVSSSSFATGEQLIALEWEPGLDQLYGVSNKARSLYAVIPTSGEASPLAPTLAPNGSAAGIAYNATTGLAQVCQGTASAQLDFTTGYTTQPAYFFKAKDPSLPGTPNIREIAVDGTGMVFGIDSSKDILVTIDPTTGTVATVGPLGVDIDSQVGFDVSYTGIPYAAVTVGGVSKLCTVNLKTGALTDVGTLPSVGGEKVIGIATKF